MVVVKTTLRTTAPRCRERKKLYPLEQIVSKVNFVTFKNIFLAIVTYFKIVKNRTSNQVQSYVKQKYKEIILFYQGRIFSYPDTQRHRLGGNYLQLPINCPYRVNKVTNYQRDGPQCLNDNCGRN